MSTFPRVRSVGCERNHTRGTTRTRNFCKFCKTFVPVPETSLSSVRPWHNARGTGMPFYEIPGGGGGYGYCTTFVYLPGTFCEFCKTSIPVPGTSVSSVRLPYPYVPRMQTVHNLYFQFSHFLCFFSHVRVFQNSQSSQTL